MKFDDYLLRALEDFNKFVARIVKALRDDEEQIAESEIAGAYEALLGGDRVFLGMVDAATLANLLGSPDKVRVLARLSALDARLAHKRGDAARSQRLQVRARELLGIAHRDDPQDGDDTLLVDLET
ncbi:MAG: hypothetical protein RLZZ450_3446 [Pseudomonadota bacterium]|jgi:hypothetical protein